MKISDCFWEERNLGVKTAEIILEKDELIISEKLLEVESLCDYIVIKSPISRFDISQALCGLNYSFVEVQITLEKNLTLSDLDGEMGSLFDIKLANTDEDIRFVESKINEGLFSTDRIALDSSFGIKSANSRYVNWMKDELTKGAKLIIIINHNQTIGFILLKEDGGNMHVLLHGIFKDYLGKHLGVALTIAPYLYKREYNGNINHYYTKVSSNNIGILKVMTRAGYCIADATNVFIKHIKH